MLFAYFFRNKKDDNKLTRFLGVCPKALNWRGLGVGGQRRSVREPPTSRGPARVEKSEVKGCTIERNNNSFRLQKSYQVPSFWFYGGLTFLFVTSKSTGELELRS